MQRITPCLWFDNQAEEAAKYYVSIFKNSRIKQVTHYPESGAMESGRAKGSVMTVGFELDGQEFVALNGGPHFKLNEAVSFMVNCTSQEEIDHYWDKLTVGGDPKAQQCGWLKDKYGVSWQIVSADWAEFLDSKEPRKAEAVMQAVIQMKKPDIAHLREVYEKA